VARDEKSDDVTVQRSLLAELWDGNLCSAVDGDEGLCGDLLFVLHTVRGRGRRIEKSYAWEWCVRQKTAGGPGVVGVVPCYHLFVCIADKCSPKRIPTFPAPALNRPQF
jgi:hypothetical protein